MAEPNLGRLFQLEAIPLANMGSSSNSGTPISPNKKLKHYGFEISGFQKSPAFQIVGCGTTVLSKAGSGLRILYRFCAILGRFLEQTFWNQLTL